MISLIILHFIADFLLQSREMGKNKSSDWGYLTLHLLIQYIVFLPVLGVTWSLINALVHGLIDRNIWNIYKMWALNKINHEVDVAHDLALLNAKVNPVDFSFNPEWKNIKREELIKSFKYWEDHMFYTTIGFDQMLHMITLVLIWGAM